jgi:hypothetical protein
MMVTEPGDSFSEEIMRGLSRVCAAAGVLTVLLLNSAGAQQRSFVGKKLSGITFTDTEGHTINPDHYRGSVLVMISIVPW